MTAPVTTQIPTAHESEAVVLGCLLQDPDGSWPRVADLDDAHFHRQPHRRVWQAIARQIEGYGAESVCFSSLASSMRRSGALEQIGGVGLLSELASAPATLSTLPHHVAELRRALVGRKAVELGAEVLRQAPTAPDISALLAEKRAHLDSLVAHLDPRSGTTLKDAVREVSAALQRAVEEGTPPGLPTGYRALDAVTFGLDPTDLVILAGRPGMGKSALALGMALRVARRGGGVLFCSLEMSAAQMALRAVASDARVTTQQLKTAKLSEIEWARVARAFGQLGKLPIVFHDDPGLTPARLVAEARDWRTDDHGAPLALVVVDYLQKMLPGHRRQRREEEVSFVAGELKRLALGLKVPVLALAQLNRGVEAREDKRPRLSDLRESGAIEQDADQVWMVYRGDYYDDPDAAPGVAEVLVRKARSGATGGAARLRWTGEHTRFDDLEESRVDWRGGEP